jgi:hypothetical protein
MKNLIAASLVAAGLVGLAAAPVASARTPAVANFGISEAEVIAAQKAWGAALVQISKDYESGGLTKAKATASAVLDAAYGYNLGPVLFKPTLTKEPQTFRPTKDGALAYFVGGDSSYPADSGFALKGWRSVEIANNALFIDGDTAMTMGKVTLTDKDGKKTTVDKTWVFRKDDRGQLRIVVHHSSLPFTGT